MRVALAQLEPRQQALPDNVETVLGAIAEHGGCDLIVFPELFLSGISRDGYERLRVELDGPELAAIGDAAKEAEAGVVIGTALAAENGTENAAVTFSRDGSVSGVYRKTHPWSSESRHVAAGTRIAPTPVGDLSAGLMICFDVEFPEVARALTLAGAEVLITIAANMEPYGFDHALLARARAVENRISHVYVNRVGEAAGSRFVGESCVIDSRGAIVAQAGTGSEVIEVEVPLAAADADPQVDYVKQRRPELYGALIEPDPI